MLTPKAGAGPYGLKHSSALFFGPDDREAWQFLLKFKFDSSLNLRTTFQASGLPETGVA
jgi:hypothetical protein